MISVLLVYDTVYMKVGTATRSSRPRTDTTCVKIGKDGSSVDKIAFVTKKKLLFHFDLVIGFCASDDK